MADIEKADTFNDKMEERKLRRITDEIWDVCFALENSLCSIIRDEEVTDKAALMNQSIDEFDVAIKGLVTSWGAGKTAQIVKTTGENQYGCKVDQVIVGIDQIAALNYQRSHAPGVQDPRRAKVRFANEQMSLHLDILFAKGFFHSGVWEDEWQGTDSNPTGKKFLKFNEANFDPVHFFDERRRDIKRRGRLPA